MAYTWEDVMLGIDTRAEAKREQKQQQDIMDKQADEESAMAGWSLGLSILGAALFGPAGYTAGKFIGRHGADAYYDWEDMAVDEGKFYKEDAREFKKTRDKAAKDQTQGQILNAVTDLASMYVMAGGLQEGFGSDGVMSDLTTFGTGDDAWTVFGQADKTGTLGSVASGKYSGINIPGGRVAPLARTLPKDQALFSGGLKEAGKKLSASYGIDQSITSIDDLYSLWKNRDEDKS